MITRRSIVKHVAYAGALATFAPLVRAIPANGKANLTGIGVGGKGWGDIYSTSTGQNVVAICDIDDGPDHLGRAAKQWPNARRYNDWRKLLEESKDIDGLTISTPDHMHAPIAYSAMSLGKHVYLQKPLCHDLHEVRTLTAAAKRFGVITQMGNQHHSTIAMR
jgi:predicted dehydrogenase